MTTNKVGHGVCVWIGAIAIATIVGWTGAAEGAECSLSPQCLTYIPFAAVGGTLFAPIALIVAAVMVAIAFIGFKVRSGIVTWLILPSIMGVLGFVFGSLPGVHGQGP
ncbi:MAG TPA: hypothetical protein VIJ12_01495 [Candidatus Baltobacteraceae bacterium]